MVPSPLLIYSYSLHKSSYYHYYTSNHIFPSSHSHHSLYSHVFYSIYTHPNSEYFHYPSILLTTTNNETLHHSNHQLQTLKLLSFDSTYHLHTNVYSLYSLHQHVSITAHPIESHLHSSSSSLQFTRHNYSFVF